MLKKIFPLYWAILLFPVCNATAQHTTIRTHSLPPIQNFSDDDYNSYIQNWGIAQDTSGLIYVANLGEVLQYDGVRWQTIQVENQTALSIGRSPEGKMYVGGLGSFGYLDNASSDTSLSPTYYSLTDTIADSAADFSNVWNILFHNESVYFDTQEGLYRLNNEHISNIKPENLFRKAFKIDNSLLVSDTEKGLFYVKDNRLTAVGKSNPFLDRKVMVILPRDEDYWLIADRTKGLSIFDGADLTALQSEVDEFLINNDVYTGIILPDSTYLFGTLNDGIVHVDKEGRLLRKIDSKRGLIGDQVHSFFLDKDHNVWVALGNGLSLIEPMSSVSYLDERNNISGIVYDLQTYRGYLYASTNEGLFRLDIQKDSGGDSSKPLFKDDTGRKTNENIYSDGSSKGLFKPLFEGSYRCKDIIQYGEGLIVDCSHSVYLVSDDKTAKIADGFDIQLIRGSVYKENYYYVLGREGFRIFDSSHKPIFENKDFGHVFNSLIEEDNGDIWIGTETNGVFRLEADFLDSLNNFKSYLHHYKVPHDKSNRSLRVFHIAGEAIIASASGLFSYNETANSLVREHRFGEEMADPERQVFLMEEDTEGNVWIRSDSEHQVLLKEKNGYRYAEAELKRIDENQVNRLYAHESGLVWIAGNDRIIQYDMNKDWLLHTDKTELFKASVRGVYVRGDSLINADLVNNGYELAFEDNDLRFEYAAMRYRKPSEIRYQVRLEGFKEDWSSWSAETQKDYTNIPEGTYTFHVRAKDVFGTVGKADMFSFVVFPPWYRSWWAYSLYVLLTAGILYGMHRIRINRILRVQRIRNRIASDLHDEVSATLSSIRYFAEAIQQGTQEQNERFVGLISESADEAKEKITDIIWSIEPENDDWVDLLSKCRRFASDLFESKNIDYELDIDTDINHSLGLELRQHLWLIFKEMAVNAARHSGADRVEVVFGIRNSSLKLVVRDNGIGMNGTAGKQSGKGIKSIRNRANKINAELRLESKPGRGTEWIMILAV